MFQQYYKILELSESATIEQITKAYRIKAKQFHPDVNPHRDAHQYFILLNEAYQILIKYKKNPSSFNSSTYENWMQEEKRKANAEAEKQAQMRYQEYINSDDYRYLNSMNILLDHLGFFVSIFLPIAIPILFFKWYGLPALIPATILLLFFSPYLLIGWSLRKKLHWERFKISFSFLNKFEHFKLFWLSAVNLFLFWNYALVTMIDMKFILLFYVLSIGICSSLWQFYFKKRIKISLLLLLVGIAPLIANAIFVTNFYISFNAVDEQYEFAMQRGSMMQLENNAYDDCRFIRFFPDPDRTRPYSKIKFTFANGIYGWRVMKNYELIE